MKSKKHGKNTSDIEISHISIHGIWVSVAESEYFLPFEQYPWFKNASISDIQNIQLLHTHHLRWPDLDLDLDLDSLKNPEFYPLLYK